MYGNIGLVKICIRLGVYFRSEIADFSRRSHGCTFAPIVGMLVSVTVFYMLKGVMFSV